MTVYLCVASKRHWEICDGIGIWAVAEGGNGIRLMPSIKRGDTLVPYTTRWSRIYRIHEVVSDSIRNDKPLKYWDEDDPRAYYWSVNYKTKQELQNPVSLYDLKNENSLADWGAISMRFQGSMFKVPDGLEKPLFNLLLRPK